MDEAIAKKIVDENREYKIHEDYSGRGMYGKMTTAVTVPNKDDIGYLRKKYGEEFRSDNLGLDYIVY